MGNSFGEPIAAPVPGAPPGSQCTGLLGDWNDGFCDDALNTAACGYDGGDCCFSTCGIGKPPGACYSIADCIDPYAEENSGLKLQVNAIGANRSIEVTITGAQPGSNVVVWVSPDINPFVIPDNSDFCPGLEVDLEFGQLVPQRFIADSNGQVRVEDFGQHGRNLNVVDPVARCSNLFQAVEVVQDSSCRKSDIAFLQEWRPVLWEPDTCYDHGYEWCNSFACPEPIEFNNCCQSAVFWCDVAVGCSADHNGTPDETTGPDVCRAYWLAYDYFLDASGLTTPPTVSPRPTITSPSSLPTVSLQPTTNPSLMPSDSPSETCEKGLFRLELKTSGSYQTTWELLSIIGNQIIYGNFLNSYTLYESRTCLDDGCYQFVIYSDGGLCSNYPSLTGYYIISLDGAILQETCDFGISDTVEFCVG